VELKEEQREGSALLCSTCYALLGLSGDALAVAARVALSSVGLIVLGMGLASLRTSGGPPTSLSPRLRAPRERSIELPGEPGAGLLVWGELLLLECKL
jgi:hypothetical protein